MLVVEEISGKLNAISAKEVSPEQAKSLSSALAYKIIRLLAEKPAHPYEIAKKLDVHEQKVYYHIRKLHKAGIIKLVRKDGEHRAYANVYSPAEKAVVVRFGGFEPIQRINAASEPEKKFFEPFITNGSLNCLIIVGSPDPHGPDRVRSRDGYYGMDLALLLGTHLNHVSKLSVRLDTEVKDSDLKESLVLIGGPVVNKVTARFNEKLPVRFDKSRKWAVYSSLSRKHYPSDECGIIVKAKNPFNRNSMVLVIAGKRYAGTRAAIIGFLQGMAEIADGNRLNRSVYAKVVEGLDADSDGVIDSAEFIE